jgi:hypothetical protein
MKFPNPIRFLAAMALAFWRWVRRERVIVPEEVQIERELTCHHRCPHYDPAADQCPLCTCFVTLKVMFADEKCPDKPRRWKKWKEDPLQNWKG